MRRGQTHPISAFLARVASVVGVLGIILGVLGMHVTTAQHLPLQVLTAPTSSQRPLRILSQDRRRSMRSPRTHIFMILLPRLSALRSSRARRWVISTLPAFLFRE
jgi:hypothetical protein